MNCNTCTCTRAHADTRRSCGCPMHHLVGMQHDIAQNKSKQEQESERALQASKALFSLYEHFPTNTRTSSIEKYLHHHSLVTVLKAAGV